MSFSKHYKRDLIDLIIKKTINMKKSYLLAAAVTMLTACTNNERLTNDLSYDGPVMIGFETFHEKSTKATVTGEITARENLNKTNGGFGVWGYKGNDASASTTPKTLAESGYTTIFDNVQVWYDGTSETKGFTYLVPKYWDKGMKYIFFAYAPYDAVKATIDWKTDENHKGKGLITISDIPSIQDLSKSNADPNATPAQTVQEIVFSGSDQTKVTDYLMATCVQNQYLTTANTTTSTQSGTNQNYVDSNNGKTAYTQQEQTVGFTFGHMLSRITVKLKAATQYNGVMSMKVSYLAIKNMPEVKTDVTSFTQTAPTAAAGAYAINTWSGKTLQIINSGEVNTNATSKNDLYILKNGVGKKDANTTTTIADEMTTIGPPEDQPQTFYYYVAPNTPSGNAAEFKDHYYLSIKYTIKYVDNVEENVVIENMDLNSQLASMLQNNSYKLTINVGLNQIYFTVDKVDNWTEIDEQTIEVN